MKRSVVLWSSILGAFALGFVAGGWRSPTAPRADGLTVAGDGRPVLDRPAPSPDTDSLVRDFHDAWNGRDLPGMVSRLQSTAFFRSPYQLRYGRDTMIATVLQTNPPRFREVETEEWHSFTSPSLAWSIGALQSRIHDDEGRPTGERGNSEYLYVFTPGPEEDWKVQMLVYHERCE